MEHTPPPARFLLTSRPMRFDRRAAGILIHLTSLPGGQGNGDLSPESWRPFVDWLSDAGMTWWQMLPVGPTDGPPYNSPYTARSSRAGNPYLVGLEPLLAEGLLEQDELSRGPGGSVDAVDYVAIRERRGRLLRTAFARFQSARPKWTEAFDAFIGRSDWVDDFALYSALKEKTGQSWWEWEIGLRTHEPAAIETARRDLADAVEFHRWVQFEFDRQWQAMHAYAKENGVALLGDLPIFVSDDSVDVWQNQRLFKLGKNGRATHVTGVPPDPFAKEGQRWGHPQYEWKAHRAENFAWWLDRFGAMFERFDGLRIDHFIGFDRAWSIPAKSPNAVKGKWVKAPGAALFKTLKEHLGDRAIIAEDLGNLTPSAAALRDRFAFPGMRVLQWAFGDDDYHRAYKCPERSILYTGTHDNDTTAGWFTSLGHDSKERKRVLALTGDDERRVAQGLVRLAMNSPAAVAIFPMQDVLGLGSEAKMNVPGRGEGNWMWRVRGEAMTPELAAELRKLAEATGRAKVVQVASAAGADPDLQDVASETSI